MDVCLKLLNRLLDNKYQQLFCLLLFGFTMITTYLLFPCNLIGYRNFKTGDLYLQQYSGTQQNTSYDNAKPRDTQDKVFIRQSHQTSISRNALSYYHKYIQMKNIQDFDEPADDKLSLVSIHWDAFEGVQLWDDIKVTISLRNSYGIPLRTGGDILRIWMTEPSLKASVSGYVMDHKNGTYTGHLKALWTGNPLIKVSLAAKKEQVAYVMKYIEEKGLLHNLYAQYVHGRDSEIVRCSTIPKVSGYTEVCNFTSINYGMDWFCGKPSTSSQLNCSHWKNANSSKITRLSADSKVDIYQLKRKNLLLSSVRIRVVGAQKTVKTRNISCSHVAASATWNDFNPIGFYYNDSWRLLTCRNTFNPVYKSYLDCLSGHHLVLAGDSNLRSWFQWLQNKLHMEIVTKGYKSNSVWHTVVNAERKDIGTTMVWTPHEIPFYNGFFTPKESMKAVSQQLDDISQPSHISIVVIIHLYFHLAKISPKQFRLHVRNARQGVDRLLRRRPNARVFIKGPHGITYVDIVEPIDYMRKFQEQIFFEEFQGLHNRVVYLDHWEMTVAQENVHLHPPWKIIQDGLGVFLGYYCRNASFVN